MDLMAIDLGTSSVKVTITDSESGKILASGKQGYCFYTPHHGWIETDPTIWWTCTILAIKECLAEYPAPADHIAAIGLSGQMHGIIPIDAKGRELYNCIMYNDSRSEIILDQIPDEVREKLEYGGCNPLTSMMSAPKLLWLKLKEPEIWRDTRKWIMPKDFIRMRLSGDISTDISDASGTSMMDYETKQWMEIVEKIGLPLDKFPEIRPSHEVVSIISKQAELLTGLKIGTPIVCGAADMACTALGTGAIGPGLASVTIGSAGHVIVSMNRVDRKNIYSFYQMCHAIPGEYYAFGPILSGGLNLSWLRDRLCEVSDDLTFSQLDTFAAESPVGSSGLYFLPYLAGSVIPDSDTNARGAFVGLSLQHQTGDLIRAIMEGLGYAFQNALHVMKASGVYIDRCNLGEGGSKSKLWCSILAAMFDVKQCAVVSNKDSAPVGATILAGMGVGAYQKWDEAVTKLNNATPIEADKNMQDFYKHGFEIYKKIYPALKDIMKDINLLQGKD